MHTNLRSLSALSLALMVLLSACSSGGSQQPAPAIPGLAQTLAAQTLTAPNSLHARVVTQQAQAVDANLHTSLSYLPTSTPEAQASPEIQLTPLKQTQMARTALEESCTNQAEFVRDISVPDETKMKSGQRFVKTWQFKNVGTCTWSKDYAAVFVWGEKMGGNDPMSIGVEVVPDQLVNISIELVAPKEPNFYQGNWIFQTPAGDRFGTGYQGRQFFWVSIVVGGGGLGGFQGGCVGGG